MDLFERTWTRSFVSARSLPRPALTAPFIIICLLLENGVFDRFISEATLEFPGINFRYLSSTSGSVIKTFNHLTGQQTLANLGIFGNMFHWGPEEGYIISGTKYSAATPTVGFKGLYFAHLGPRLTKIDPRIIQTSSSSTPTSPRRSL